MGMKRSLKLAALARSFSTHAGPPIRVAITLDAGRGVFATRNINEGEIIHTAEPLITHPSLQNLSKACFFCLKRLACQLSTKDGVHMETSTCQNELQVKFCSQNCSDSAKAFYAFEKKAEWKIFNQFCGEQDLRLPLLAKRLVCMILSGMVSRDALDILAFVKPPHDTASCWMLTKTMLLGALKGSGVPEDHLAFISDEWYCGVMARISLNSFRVELLVENSTNLLAAAAASVSGDAVVGSAVYVLPSMYNHDCDPNVDVLWLANATAHMSARRDIEQGEELRITYIDASMSQPARQQLLKQAYHFECNCSRCKDND